MQCHISSTHFNEDVDDGQVFSGIEIDLVFHVLGQGLVGQLLRPPAVVLAAVVHHVGDGLQGGTQVREVCRQRQPLVVLAGPGINKVLYDEILFDAWLVHASISCTSKAQIVLYDKAQKA